MWRLAVPSPYGFMAWPRAGARHCVERARFVVDLPLVGSHQHGHPANLVTGMGPVMHTLTALAVLLACALGSCLHHNQVYTSEPVPPPAHLPPLK
jgi:hypothetical protein